MNNLMLAAFVMSAGVAAGSASAALSVTSSNFDQIARINVLGGSVTQISGTTPGAVLANAGSFGGAPDTQSGVAVLMLTWRFGQSATITDSGASEPGNINALLTGVPTDLTFTTPGAGGPDGTIGDGSIHFTVGDTAVVGMGGSLLAGFGNSNDLFIFTNSNGGGTIDLALLLGGVPVDGIVGLTVPGGTPGSGTGAVLLNLPDGLVYDTVAWVCRTGEVEIDAVAAPYLIPAPGAAGITLGLTLLGARRRRR